MKTWTPQDEESFQFELGHLQDEGHVKSRISKATLDNLKAKMLEEDMMIEEAIETHHPELFTAKYKKDQEEQGRENRKLQKIGEFAPTIGVGKLEPLQKNEPKATIKQIEYLRQLGVRDEKALSSLGKWQASDLIDRTVNYRREYVTGDKISAASVVAMVIKIAIPIALVAGIFFILKYIANK